MQLAGLHIATPNTLLVYARSSDAAGALGQHNAGTPHYSTWRVLFSLLVSDKLRRLVLRGERSRWPN